MVKYIVCGWLFGGPTARVPLAGLWHKTLPLLPFLYTSLARHSVDPGLPPWFRHLHLSCNPCHFTSQLSIHGLVDS
jgi:hypothetical protein